MFRRTSGATVALLIACSGLYACDNGLRTSRQPAPVPSTAPAATVSSGGATVESDQHKARLVIGGPQPVGASSSQQHQVTLGPAAE